MPITLMPQRLEHGKDHGGKDGKNHGSKFLLVVLKSRSLPNKSEEYLQLKESALPFSIYFPGGRLIEIFILQV